MERWRGSCGKTLRRNVGCRHRDCELLFPAANRPVISFGGARNDTTGHFRLGKPATVATLRKKFGRRLRAIRAQRQMTQERFAEMLGISVDFLSLIERGVNAPSFEMLERISKKLRMAVAELFTFE